MKLSISNIAWDNSYNEEIYVIMQKYGFCGLEIAPTKLFSQTPYDCLEEAKNWAENLKSKYGFEIPSMQSIWYGRNEKIFETNEERQILIEYTKKAIDFASVIKCKNLVFGCPKNRNINKDSDYNTAVQFFEEIGDYALFKGTAIGMEANPVIYNTNFINDTKSALKLIKDVKSDGFKLNLDIGTMIQNEESASELIGQVEQINHVHISEPYLALIQKRGLHNEIIQILKNENYEKYISIEMRQQDSINDIENTFKYINFLIKGGQ